MATHFLALFSSLLLAITIKQSKASYSKTVPFPTPKQEKQQTHLHFYFHDIISGNNPTAIKVAEAPNTNSSATSFGAVFIADDPLTEGPDPKSKEVGRAQGMYGSADMNTFGFVMVFNLVFTQGEFNGSTLAMYGRNPILSKVREMPIIGGTGAFRFAKGYAQAETYKSVDKDAVVEYNVYVSH